MSIAVLVPAYTNHHEEWGVLRESAAACGAELHVVNRGGYNPMKSISDMMEALQLVPHEYVVSTDAYDTMMCRWDEDEVIAAIQAQPSGLLVSCEVNCYPSGPWGTAYAEEQSIWRYCNGGQSAGKKESVLALWKEFISGRWPVEMGGGTQEMLHRLYASGYPMGRDTSCQIFQSMSNVGDAIKFDTKSGVICNTETGSRPMFLHFNGRTSGLEKAYEWWRQNGKA